MDQVSFCVESATLALRGARLLAAAGINAQTVRSNCGRGGSCAFELTVSAERAAAAAEALRRGGVNVLNRRGM